ncbi:class I SAM-dependent methyltransferase [candidate division KSB1 bacterium]|nr:class I SAM-dependent methyltransferase [candidate division KSB1 bacterium]
MNLWEFKAGFYDSARRLFPFNLILSKESANLKNLLSKIDVGDGKILDVGTGTGTSLAFWGESAQLFALDSSFNMINKAKLKGSKNLIVGDALALPIKSDSFNLIIAIGLLEYQKEKIAFLKEFQRILIPTGCLLLTYSQIGLLNFMRFLGGHRLYLLSSAKFNRLIQESGLTCLKKARSLIQTQILLHDNSGTHG